MRLRSGFDGTVLKPGRSGVGIYTECLIAALADAQPPVAIYTAAGVTALLETGLMTTRIRATVGEQVCAFKLSLPADGASPTYCDDAP